MRFFHPLYKLKASRVLANDGIFTGLINTFQTDHMRNIYNIFLRGQNGFPIRQHDIDTAATKMQGLVKQRLTEYEARIKSMERETEDLIQQTAKPAKLVCIESKPSLSYLW